MGLRGPIKFRLGVSLAILMGCRVSNAQLVGCDAVQCPTDQMGQIHCQIGEVLATEIGITNFSTTFEPQPLTWTVSVSMSEASADASLFAFTRDFWLGTAPSVNLSDTGPFTGCALFFEGISSTLRFPGPDIKYTVGTCNDALNASCVSDVMSQANLMLVGLVSSGSDPSTICSALASGLRDSAPPSCNVAHNSSWGSIISKDFTSDFASRSIQLGQCRATTGADYSLSHVESYNITTGHLSSSVVNPFVYGITPIMTILLPSNDTSATPSSSSVKPDLHLSCLKALEAEPQGPGFVAAGNAGALRPGVAVIAVALLLAVGLTFF